MFRPPRSQAAVDQLVGRDDAPGCSAAVAERGVVVWQGSRILADLDSHAAITSARSFSIGSVSKQFIAIGVLLLEQAGQLSTSDRLSEHVHGLAAWADRVTFGSIDPSCQVESRSTSELWGRKAGQRRLLPSRMRWPKFLRRSSCGFRLAPNGSIQIPTTYSSA